ncbi:MAG: DnaD domain protein [Oscillospiraceae bacterium]|nr:DnaD domain protein [Oscillospiraceae bacterium]
MEFNFNLGLWGGIFAVPNAITDDYIKIATGDNLKVLLYCLRYAGQTLSVGEVSRATGIPPDNVTSSLEFWQQRMATGNETSLIFSDKKIEFTKKEPTELLDRDYDFSPKEISEIIKNSKDVDYLFKRCEELYGRPLKHNEQKALAVIVEDAGMNAEVALMLMVFCFSINKTTVNYIKKTAKNWIEQGIDSHELAEGKIKSLKEYYSAEGELKRLLEIRAIPDDKKPLFEKWLYQYGFSVETIYMAYQKTLEKTGKLQYTFMDKVLAGLNDGTSVLTNDGKIEFAKSGKDAKTTYVPKSAKTRVSDTPSFDLDKLDKQIMEEYREMLGMDAK